MNTSVWGDFQICISVPLRSHSGISIKWTPLVHDKSVRFIESPSKNQKSSKVNIKSTICHFQVQIYWKDQETKRLKKMQSFSDSKVFKQGSLH